MINKGLNLVICICHLYKKKTNKETEGMIWGRKKGRRTTKRLQHPFNTTDDDIFK